MNKIVKQVLVFGAVALIAAGAAGGALWYAGMRPAAMVAGAAPGPAAEAEPAERKPVRYVTLDKVIVMLRRSPQDTSAHYISTDLVLATTAEDEKTAKEHLPMLRSVAVRTLSALPLATASTMAVEQYAAQLNAGFKAHYDKEKSPKPFANVMIGKLIIE